MNEFATIGELARGLRQGDYSSVELIRHYLARIEANSTLNTFITVAEDEALNAAASADQAFERGEAGPLTGIPLAHKDIFCTQGIATTCGSRILENWIAPYDATVVDRLAHAGAVLLGKTNMDEFAMGSSNENSYFGAALNPWDSSRVPGGSSGGSAAAVAAGLTPVATGTDTGGSIRQPAAFCGVAGIKPTYGRVSRYGMAAFASSLDQAGVFGHDAQDLAVVLSLMSGFDPRDSTSSDRADSWLTGVSESGLKPNDEGLTIGLPSEYFKDLNEGATLLQAAAKEFENAGCRLTQISLPHTDAAIPAYYIIAGAEASTNLARYDGVHFGYRCENPKSLEDLYQRSRSEGFGTEVKRRILTGTYALSVGYFDAYYLKAQKLRRLIQQDFLSAFEEVDLILAPTTPGVAFHTGDLTDDPVAMYQQDIFTIPASLAGLPALSLPCGFTGGLPIGMQLIGPHFSERRLLETSALYQQNTDWHQRHPEVA